MQFSHSSPVKLVFGPGRLDALATEPLPGTKALLLTSNGTAVERIGALGRVKTMLEARGVPYVHVAAVEPNPLSTTVMAVSKTVREEKCDFIIALGGGVVGDLAGFAAATYLRGMDFIQIPTTLLAQVDSSVGGKTAIDLKGGKNLVGAFKQPVCVLCDPDTLRTLPSATFSDGMGEVVKYGMIRDAKLFELLAAHNQETIFSVLEDVICTCISIKRDVVEADEFDTGERMILNYGHTLGHAIEGYYHYETYSHGSAVAIGMCLIAEKTCTPEQTAALKACLQAYHLPTSVPVPISDLLPFCGVDKKRAGNQLRYIVCETPGKAEIRTATISAFAAWMEEQA